MTQTTPDSPFAAGEEPAGSAGFFARLFLMPFWPPLWRQAAGAYTGEIVAPVLALAVLLNCAWALTSVWGLGAEFRSMAASYDASWDPIVWHDGQIDVEGTRLVHVDDGRQTFLVDPDETIDIASLSGEFVVVRRHEVIRQRAFGPLDVTPLAGFADLVGPGPVRVDSASLDGFWDAHGPSLQVGAFALVAVLSSAVDAISAALYAMLAASLVRLLLARQAPWASLFRVALAASASTIVLGVILRPLGAGLGCWSLFVWPALITAATAVAAPAARR